MELTYGTQNTVVHQTAAMEFSDIGWFIVRYRFLGIPVLLGHSQYRACARRAVLLLFIALASLGFLVQRRGKQTS